MLLLKRVFNIVVILFFISFLNPAEAASLFSLQSAVDWSCISFQIIGICVKKTPPYVGLKVRYWEPALLVETVKRPGDSVIGGLGTVISVATQEATKILMAQATGLAVPVTSGSSSQALSQTNLQFNEVHVYNFPFMDIFSSLVSMQCSFTVATPGFIKYLSELDAVEWRLGFLEMMSPKSVLSASLGPICSGLRGYSHGLCMGFWGSVYPRRGFFIHQSEVVGSAAAAFRGVSIASIMGSSPHIVLSPLGFIPNSDKDKLQLIYPVPSSCIRIGANPVFWESGKTSINGKYLWVYWRHRECCIF